MKTRATLLALLAAAALAGCDGDDGGGGPSGGPFGTTTEAEQAPPAERAPEERPEETGTDTDRRPRQPGAERLKRTPRSLAGCIREGDRVGEVIVKGRSSEDATYFADLVGGRVDVLGVTMRGQGAEHSIFLFESPEDARKAAPGAGGTGFQVQLRGAALVVAPPRADTATIAECLSATGYDRG